MNLAMFAGAAFVLGMIPGPSTAVILRQALRSGRRAAWAATAGNETGLLLWCIAASTGLTTLIVASHVAYETIRLAGAAFLVFLGINALRNRTQHEEVVDEPAVPPSGRGELARSYRVGLATVLANPKAAVFAFSFLPQFIGRQEASFFSLLLLSLVWISVDALWYVILTFVVTHVHSAVAGSAAGRWATRLSGGFLIGLGLWIGIGDT